jgi:hypothetical protein
MQTKINEDLVDELPTVEVDLLQLPEDRQRRLFDAFQLELRYNRHLHQLTLKATVHAETIDTLRQTSKRLSRRTISTAASRNNDIGARRTGIGPPERFPCSTCPRQDSNLRSRLRRAVLYPLSYGGSATRKRLAGTGLHDRRALAHRLPRPRAGERRHAAGVRERRDPVAGTATARTSVGVWSRRDTHRS